MISRILHMIGLGRVSQVDDSGDLQVLQITIKAQGVDLPPGVFDKVKRVGEYGIATHLPDDTDVVMVRLNGERNASIVIGTSHKASRPKDLPKDDVWLYDTRNHFIKLTEDGIEVDAAGDQVTVTNASKVRCECDIETTGDVVSRCDEDEPVSLNKLRDYYDTHIHPPKAKGNSWGSGPPDKQV